MVIIDVRSRSEYDQGHIEGSVWFSVEEMIAGKMPDISKDEEVMLYCRSGARSNAAAYLMRRQGFENVMSGGGLANMVMRGHQIAY